MNWGCFFRCAGKCLWQCSSKVNFVLAAVAVGVTLFEAYQMWQRYQREQAKAP